MKIYFLLLGCCISLGSYAQQRGQGLFQLPPGPAEKGKQFSTQTDSVRAYQRQLQALRKAYHPDTTYGKNQMPNAFTARQRQLLVPVYRNNNGKGLDVFTSPLDNTPILKPDSTFYSAMPVKTYQLTRRSNEK